MHEECGQMAIDAALERSVAPGHRKTGRAFGENGSSTRSRSAQTASATAYWVENQHLTSKCQTACVAQSERASFGAGALVALVPLAKQS